MPNSGEYKSKVGLASLYMAEVTQDDASAYVAETPEWLAPAANASQEPSVSSETQYADDQAYDVNSAEGETKITLEVTNIPLEKLALMTGREFDPTTGRMYDNSGVAPFFALSFKSLKSNGKYKYYQYLKGKFSMPKEEIATRKEKPEPKTITIEYTAIKTVKTFVLSGSVTDGVKRVVGDEDITGFSGASWFSAVQIPAIAAISALALSASVPVDGASGVSKTANLTLTFNNAQKDASLANIVLLDNLGAVLTTTVTLDATKMIVTVAHAALTGSTQHTLVYGGVMDIYGQTLTDTVVFTTAA